MPPKQGDLDLLNHPAAQELLQSQHLARLAYVWPDGTPRVVPIWFHWTGEEVVFGTPPDAPKMKALQNGSRVEVTIDNDAFPAKVLTLRGTANVQTVDGVVPEYIKAAERYMGTEAAQGWIGQVDQLWSQQVRIAVRPEWVSVIDFTQERPPSAVARAFERAAGSSA